MSLPAFEIFGVISVLMMLASRGVYFTSIFKGKTKPHAFSWLIWGAISSIGFAAQVAEGAGAGSWARGVSAGTCFLVALLGLYRGEKNITRGDWITFIVALCTIPLWIITKTPVWSVVLVCIIDTIGYLPTVRKSWSKPRQEPVMGYAISVLSSFFAILAIEHYTVSTWLYPLVLTITNGSFVLLLLARRFTIQSKTARA